MSDFASCLLQTGGGAEQFDFGPKEYHVTLSFQQAAMGVIHILAWIQGD